MIFKYLEDIDITEVCAEKEDKCLLCAYFDICPLIGALETNTVYPSASELHVEECMMYEPDDILA